MLLALVLLVFGSVGAQTPAPKPPVEQAPVAQAGPTIECPTCAGKKIVAQACLACDGAGQMPCAWCNRAGAALESARNEKMPLDSIEQVRKNMAELRKMLKLLGSKRPTAKRTKARPLAPGRRPCPAQCDDGEARVEGGPPCRYCAKAGDIACALCSEKHTRACPLCAETGRVERECETCFGLGRIQDPRTIAAVDRKRCPLCRGQVVRACDECEKGVTLRVCIECRGEKEVVCETCSESKVVPCKTCHAAGTVRAERSAKPATCGACGGRGAVACRECAERGRGECRTCLGKGRTELRCLACQNDGERPCTGCFSGAHAAWELAADIAERAGDRANAAIWLDLARKRAEARYAVFIEYYAALDVDDTALRRKRDAELRQLATRAAALRAPAPK